MDKKLERQLRKASFVIMAGQLEAITGRTYLSVSEVASILRVSRPTAKKYMENLIDLKKAVGHKGNKGQLYIVVYFSQYTTKEMDLAKKMYTELIEAL